MSGRELVSSLLLLVALFALVTMPAGVGQSLTLTTVGTTQGLSTVFHTAAYTTLFVIPPTGTYGCMPQAYGPFTLTEGEALSVDVTSNIPISIYIMTANDYHAWAGGGGACAAGSNVLYNREKVSSDYIDMIAPSSGDYYLVLLNFSPTNSASVNVGYTDISQAVATVLVPVVTEVPVTEPLQQYGFYVIIFVLVLTLGFLLALRLRSSKKKTVETATVAAKQAAPISGRFCGDCGKPISTDAKFCPECGASTEDG